MTISKTTITGPIYLPNCEKPSESRIVFELSSWDRQDNEAVFVSGPYIANLDEDGNFSVDLFSSTEGENGVVYRASVIYLDITGQFKREYLGSFALSGPGPYNLSTIDMVDEFSHTNSFDVLAQVAAYAESAKLSQDLVRDAEGYAKRAENALDAVTALGIADGPYPDAATGISQTSQGDYFVIPGGESLVELYLHEAGSVATLVSSYPSESRIIALELLLGTDDSLGNVMDRIASIEKGQSVVFSDSSGSCVTLLNQGYSGNFISTKDNTGYKRSSSGKFIGKTVDTSTFLRNSPTGELDVMGKLVEYSANNPSVVYDSDSQVKGIAIRPENLQLLTHNNDISDDQWITLNTIKEGGYQVGPLGNTTTLVTASGTGLHSLRQTDPVEPGTYTLCAIVKKGTTSQTSLALPSSRFGETVITGFDIENQTITNIRGNPDSSGMKEIYNGWWLIWITDEVLSPGTSAFISYLLDSSGDFSFISNSESMLYSYIGAIKGDSPFPLIVRPDFNASVREPDNMTFDLEDASNVFTASVGYYKESGLFVNGSVLFTLYDENEQDYVRVVYSNDVWNLEVYVSDVLVGSSVGHGSSVEETITLVSNGDSIDWRIGDVNQTSVDLTVPVVNKMSVGSQFGTTLTANAVFSGVAVIMDYVLPIGSSGDFLFNQRTDTVKSVSTSLEKRVVVDVTPNLIKVYTPTSTNDVYIQQNVQYYDNNPGTGWARSSGYLVNRTSETTFSAPVVQVMRSKPAVDQSFRLDYGPNTDVPANHQYNAIDAHNGGQSITGALLLVDGSPVSLTEPSGPIVCDKVSLHMGSTAFHAENPTQKFANINNVWTWEGNELLYKNDWDFEWNTNALGSTLNVLQAYQAMGNPHRWTNENSQTGTNITSYGHREPNLDVIEDYSSQQASGPGKLKSKLIRVWGDIGFSYSMEIVDGFSDTSKLFINTSVGTTIGNKMYYDYISSIVSGPNANNTPINNGDEWKTTSKHVINYRSP